MNGKISFINSAKEWLAEGAQDGACMGHLGRISSADKVSILLESSLRWRWNITTLAEFVTSH
jgi:hypothetical protein